MSPFAGMLAALHRDAETAVARLDRGGVAERRLPVPTIGSAALASPVDISSAVTEIRMGFTVRSPRMAGPPPG
ncbi:hypothetical protein RLEG3_26515 [Rhizobium leguminosarum bv. trifolii WSM1689]|nr:hypothetical protein RLEG3_26515 [Rhizobium leguminosarum bv. trifolii WSM1689]